MDCVPDVDHHYVVHFTHWLLQIYMQLVYIA